MPLDRVAAASLVDALSSALALPVDPAYRDAVAEHVMRLLTVAVLFAEFPLPDEVEAAPIFHP